MGVVTPSVRARANMHVLATPPFLDPSSSILNTAAHCSLIDLWLRLMMALGVGGDRGKALQAIVQSLHHSSELEAWGLMVEASEEFQK